MYRYIKPLCISGLIVLLSACTEDKTALDTWVHADKGSYGAALSPDGRLLMTGEIGGFGRIWDLRQNKPIFSLQHEDNNEGGMIGGAFSDRGEVLVTIEQESIARWSARSGKLTGYWEWPNLTSVDVSADGRYALIGSKDNQAIYFDMVAGKMRFVFPHHEKVTSVSLSRDGRFALTGSNDWHASLWDLKEGKHLWSKNMKYKISLVKLSDDGELALANAFIGDAHVYSTAGKGTLVSRLDEVRMTLLSADFSNDNRILATGRVARSIDIWNVANGKRIEAWQPKVKEKFQPDSATILALQLDDNAKTLISESSTGIGQRWALQ